MFVYEWTHCWIAEYMMKYMCIFSIMNFVFILHYWKTHRIDQIFYKIVIRIAAFDISFQTFFMCDVFLHPYVACFISIVPSFFSLQFISNLKSQWAINRLCRILQYSVMPHFGLMTFSKSWNWWRHICVVTFRV